MASIKVPQPLADFDLPHESLTSSRYELDLSLLKEVEISTEYATNSFNVQDSRYILYSKQNIASQACRGRA